MEPWNRVSEPTGPPATVIIKILFTIAVIIGVAIFYRQKAEATRTARPQPQGDDDAMPVRTLAYVLIGVLIIISVGVFAYNWQENNTVINIRVTSEGGNVVTYQAKQSEIKGRSFTTLTGLDVKLGESDRVEMLQE